MSMGWDNGEEAAELFHQHGPKIDFDEWMSGRQWLGAKAPAEGFYGRYSKEDLKLMKRAFSAGVYNEGTPFTAKEILSMSDNTAYNVEWSYEIGRKLNQDK